MAVPKSQASLSLLASLSLQSTRSSPARSARELSHLARLFFAPATFPAAGGLTGSSPLGTSAASGSRSLHHSAPTPPPSPSHLSFFDLPFNGSFGGPKDSPAQSQPQLSLNPHSQSAGPAPPLPPAPRSKPLAEPPRPSTSPNSSSTSSVDQPPSSSSAGSASHRTLRPNRYPVPRPVPFPAFFGGIAGFKAPRRGSYVFRNGASGIPKAAGSLANNSGGRCRKGKSREWVQSERGETEREQPCLSVQVGEDAYFLRGDGLGVADGVGGWSGHPGANAALFSRKLMHHCSLELSRYEDVDAPQFLSYYDVDPVDVLQRAYENCLQEAREEGIVGSSTALLAVLRNDELRIANMGDCCCSIIRGQDYIFRSEEQQHSFNYPVQVGTNSKDIPEHDAQGFTVKVQKNDIVILSSDGLVDNIWDEDILEEVLRFTGPPPSSTAAATTAAATTTTTSPPSLPASSLYLTRFSPQAVSEALCTRAKAVSEDQQAVTSPFAQRAMEEGIHYVGGKRDDITVLVAVVGDQEDSPDRR